MFYRVQLFFCKNLLSIFLVYQKKIDEKVSYKYHYTVELIIVFVWIFFNKFLIVMGFKHGYNLKLIQCSTWYFKWSEYPLYFWSNTILHVIFIAECVLSMLLHSLHIVLKPGGGSCAHFRSSIYWYFVVPKSWKLCEQK